MTEATRFSFPRQRKEPYLCIADFFRPVDSGEKDYAAFHLVTMGPAASRRDSRAVHRQPLPRLRQPARALSGDGRGARRALAPADPGGVGLCGRGRPTLTGLFRQQYRGGRYSFGYPACPDLEDNAKVVELLEGGRIGVTVSEGFQLHPEQTTLAIVCHHPKAKYFVV